MLVLHLVTTFKRLIWTQDVRRQMTNRRTSATLRMRARVSFRRVGGSAKVPVNSASKFHGREKM